MVAAFPAVNFGPLHYRRLERDKKVSMALHKGDFDRTMFLSAPTKAELLWWIENVAVSCNHIAPSDPDIIVTSDASR